MQNTTAIRGTLSNKFIRVIEVTSLPPVRFCFYPFIHFTSSPAHWTDDVLFLPSKKIRRRRGLNLKKIKKRGKSRSLLRLHYGSSERDSLILF